MPSSNFACDAILTRSVSTSYHTIFLVVLGTNPRKIPFRELFRNLEVRLVDGRTHTRQPNVQKLQRFSFWFNAICIGNLVCTEPTRPLRICIWCRKAYRQNLMSRFAPSRRQRTWLAMVRWFRSTGPFWCEESAPVGCMA